MYPSHGYCPLSQREPGAGEGCSPDSTRFWSGQDIDCFCLRHVAKSDARQLSAVLRNESRQNHLRDGVSDGPNGLVSVKARGFIDWISVEDTWESSREITSRPVNTLSPGFSDCIWGAVSALRVSANITRAILWSVRTSLTWHVDTVSEENSPVCSKLLKSLSVAVFNRGCFICIQKQWPMWSTLQVSKLK